MHTATSSDKIDISSEKQTEELAKKIQTKLKLGDVVFLYGEIGVGKTTFTRNFINHLQKQKGVKETEVLSPTFNLLYEYDIKNLKVMHYDLYRIKNSKDLDQLGIFKENFSSIKIFEWPELIETNLENRLELHLKYSNNENERELNIVGHGKWKDINKNEL
jgi:tRNA threonylcarbamoyladenosine biosynthesis protein TsaE